MQAYEKELADTDSIYCLKPTNSHQSSIFLGPTGGSLTNALLGANYLSDSDVVIELSRENLLLNVLYHFLDGKTYYKRSSTAAWNFDKNWLLEKHIGIGKVFSSITARFHVSINKETTRTYLKGIVGVKPEGGTEKLDLRNYLFAGDKLKMYRKNDGSILIVVADRGGEVEDVESTEVPKNIDLLDVALRLFKKRRVNEWRDHGVVVNAKIREYFDPLSETALAAFDEAKVTELFCGVRDAQNKIIFEPMWAGKLGQGWGNVKPNSPAELLAIVDFLVLLKHDASVVATFLQPGFSRPKGFGPSVVSELLMKFHPDCCLKHGSATREVLTTLKMVQFQGNAGSNFSDAEFKQVCGAGANILAKMKAMAIPRTINPDGIDDGQPADYLTVNEFIWFVKDQFKEIQNEVMNMSLEAPTNATNEGNKDWKDVLSNNPDDMMNRLVAALLTKPFAILAGASGTGKSRMVRKLAYMTCLNTQLQPNAAAKKPIENFRMVQVKPNWHDSSDLLGYRSSVSGTHEYVSTDFVRFVLKAHAFPNTPFFVCLDEMNLAPVEHYFAEFLSASESARIEDGEYITDPIIDPGEFYNNIANLDPQGYSIPQGRKELIEKRGLYLPKNLFVVGTVNMDDTTGGFSRKVLDRAMTIEMNEVNFDELQKPVELRLMDVTDAQGKVTEKGLLLKATQIEAFINRVDFKPDNFDDPFKTQLEDIRGKLAATTLAFAYRFARECVQYRDALKLLFPNVAGGTQYDHAGFALDHMFLMKILPRLVGNKEDRVAIVKTLETFFATLTGHGVSAKKLQDMLAAADTNGGFLSYYL